MKFNLKEQTCTFSFFSQRIWMVHTWFISLCEIFKSLSSQNSCFDFFFSFGIFFLFFFFFSYFDVITFQRPQQNSYHLCPKQKYSICLQHQTKKYCKIKGKKTIKLQRLHEDNKKFFCCCCKLLPDTVVEKVS